ncbi:TraB/GumN family protein [Ideonella sp. A 288]|uniref:TraB/GumN family protein n=1 Tax=Ideonella sp. A 288 TaxID=1962181 RepID=UPI0013032000|nr:TraB/GumN family protein [Ideonella sp. A 288]
MPALTVLADRPTPPGAICRTCRHTIRHAIRRTARHLATLVLAGLVATGAHAQAEEAASAPRAGKTAAPQPAACPPVAQAPDAKALQAHARAARDRGFLWRLSKDGREAWLYGTVHLGRLEWAFPGPRVRAALDGADTLALELDLGDPAVTGEVAELMRATAQTPVLPPALAERLARQVAAACLPAQALSSMHPVIQATTLTVLAGRWDGLDPSYAQELVLGGLARAGGKAVHSLETPQRQVAALIPSDATAAVHLTEQSLDQLERGIVRRTLQRMAQVWELGQLDELEQYERWCECTTDEADRAFMRRLNDERNPHLAERIDALHAQGKRLFAAVGALHMSGPQSLPRLLAQRGFKVERIAFAPM